VIRRSMGMQSKKHTDQGVWESGFDFCFYSVDTAVGCSCDFCSGHAACGTACKLLPSHATTHSGWTFTPNDMVVGELTTPPSQPRRRNHMPGGGRRGVAPLAGHGRALDLAPCSGITGLRLLPLPHGHRVPGLLLVDLRRHEPLEALLRRLAALQ
jgi:hypothetical protein